MGWKRSLFVGVERLPGEHYGRANIALLDRLGGGSLRQQIEQRVQLLDSDSGYLPGLVSVQAFFGSPYIEVLGSEVAHESNCNVLDD